MRITIATVGRVRSGPVAALFDEYAGRIGWPVTLKEVEVKAGPRQSAREGEALLAQCPRDARLIVLDGTGTQLDSEGLAKRLGAWRDDGVQDLAFLIGGADGHQPELLQKAAFKLSLGNLTWPHKLVRVMLTEQIYRAQQILAGHPYHRA